MPDAEQRTRDLLGRFFEASTGIAEYDPFAVGPNQRQRGIETGNHFARDHLARKMVNMLFVTGSVRALDSVARALDTPDAAWDTDGPVRELSVLREQALAELSTQFCRGHLSADTLEMRIHAVLAARTASEIRSVGWDLPALGESVWRAAKSRLVPTNEPPCTRLLLTDWSTPAVEVDGECRSWVLGRGSDCDVVLRHPSVSRRHAVLSSRGGVLAVRDLGSTNGSRVNGRKVHSARLRPGDVLAFALVEARVR